MAASKLEGYYAVAETEQGFNAYYYAIYPDGNVYKVGDKILVSGANNGVLEITNILTLEEASEKVKSISQEVIGKVVIDTSEYEKRVDRRKRATEIKKKMNQKIKELDEKEKYAFYANSDPEFGELFKEYKAIMEE